MSERFVPPEAMIVRAARLRAKLMGNASTEQQVLIVSRRPVFREPVIKAYQEGWMDALIYMEEKYGRARRPTRPDVRGRLDEGR